MTLLKRRHFQSISGLGAVSVALQSLLADDGVQVSTGPHHKPSARSVIFLFMSGGPSQVDTFDPKPALTELTGKDVPESIASRVPPIKRAGLRNLMASPWKFQQHGQCGQPVSELFPAVAEHVDSLCLIRSMSHNNPVHGPAECVALTGTAAGDRPGLGAWSLYGLGTPNQNLPGLLAMNIHTDGMQHPQAAGWGAGFLPSRYQGTLIDSQKGIRHTSMPTTTTVSQRKAELALLKSLNERHLESIRDQSDLAARIASYETAFAMQTSAPELFDISGETRATQARYGLEHPETAETGRACLLSRRMVQRGVRFVQLRIGGWDAHGNIKGNHTRMAARTDQPVAALLADLKQHDLLDSTLVVWGGEFGRTPTMEGLGNGRDHSPAAYTVWLAGGGVQGGQAIGQTDEIGYTVTEQLFRPQDLHATILHAVGIDSTRLTFEHHGLIESPVGVTRANVIPDVFG